MTMQKGPFRGSNAVRDGVVSRDQLRGPRYHRLYADVFISSNESRSLAARSRGAVLLAPDSLVSSGYSAAELLGAGFSPAGANAEITVPGGDFREQPGLTVHRDLLADDEVTTVDGLTVTTALRTAWDLARWLPTVEAVVAVDALARLGRFPPARLLRIHGRYPRARWRRRVPGVIDLSDPLAESPMETRARLVLVTRGLPRPVLQHEVYDEYGVFVARVDMAYPELRLAIEYDGRGHLTPWEQDRDARRQGALDACDWSSIRLTAPDVFQHPDEAAARVRERVARRRRSMNSTPAGF